MTVAEVIQKSAEFLRKREVDSPRLNAELLLAHVVQLPRLKLYLQFERVLTEPELDRLRQMVKRRADREPLQHILGTASFCGLEMKVNRHVLVPRPETELLAERASEFLNSSSRREEALNQKSEASGQRSEGCQSLLTSAATILDLGTGTGCLPIYLAVKHPNARVSTVDISPDALTVARENAAAHQVADRVEFLLGDLFAPVPAGSQFDLIVSNPPYIASAEIATLQPEVRDHDPRLALDGGADGLDFYRRLAAEAPKFLRAGGKLIVEFGDGQADALREIFSSHKWIVEAVVPDYSQRQRILIAHFLQP